jgi:hypothetical protein
MNWELIFNTFTEILSCPWELLDFSDLIIFSISVVDVF